MLEHKFPVTLGKDFAGTVEAVGEGVARADGDRVFGVVMKPVVSEGAFAEYVVVAEGYGSPPSRRAWTWSGPRSRPGRHRRRQRRRRCRAEGR